MADLLGSIERLALAAVLGEDPDYRLRSVFRWYSKTFHVPLPEVERLPLAHVLQTHLEVKFEEMVRDPDRRDELRGVLAQLLETESERRDRLMEEERAVDTEEALVQQIRDEEAEKERARQERGPKPEPRRLETPAAPAPLGDYPGALVRPDRLRGRDSELPSEGDAPQLPPGVEIKFVETADFDDLVDRDFAAVDEPEK